MLRGLEAQLSEWQARIPPAIASTPPLRIATLFTRVFLFGAPLLKIPSAKLKLPVARGTGSGSGGRSSNSGDAVASFTADPARLMAAIPHLHALYDYFLSLPADELGAFIGIEWGSLILAVILGFRMSLPLAAVGAAGAVCPEWDDRKAREQVRFGEYVERLCRLGCGGGGKGGG